MKEKFSLEMQDRSGPGETNLESENRAVRCPRCGSHTLRAFGVEKNEALLKCLTCGNEFKRPAMPNPESKTADAHKFIPGQRVQLTHPSYKGERGSVVDYSGKLADLDEEQYEIQLDSGEKITNIPESAFKKIKSAGFVSSDSVAHIDATANHFLETMTFQAAPGGPPGDSKKPTTIPLTEWDENKTEEHYDPDAQDQRYDDPDWDTPPECPMCNGPGNSLGAMGAREYYRCRNCGMDWALPNHSESEKWNVEDPHDLFGQDGPGKLPTSHVGNRLDSKGNKLEAGRVYLMHGKDYKVPDLVRILNLEDSRIEAAIASDAKGAFPIIIEAKDESEYHFDPVEEGKKEEVKEGAGWKIAKRNWSSKEQRELVEENPKGRARNFDKLDLSGTHYELKSAAEDPDFLWGM